jgi:hypothetical protein
MNRDLTGRHGALTCALLIVGITAIAAPADQGNQGARLGLSTSPPLPAGPGEQDLLTTCSGPNALQFGSPTIPPIPAGFFDPGSEPFFGTVWYQGVPIDAAVLGNVDTIVQRPTGPPCLPLDPPGPCPAVPIEIVALNLVSIEPITVSYPPPEPPQFWDVSIDLSSVHSPPGIVFANKTHANGGTFDAILPVLPRFTFTRVDEPYDSRVVDAGELGLPPLQLQISGAHWVHQVSPTIPIIQPPGPWVPGIQEIVPGDITSQVITPLTAFTLGVEHTVCPGTPKEQRCEVTSNTIPRNQSACTTTINGDGTRNVRVTFQMNARFRANCPCCEYRQFVRGSFRYKNKKKDHRMNPGVLLDPDELREDGFGVPGPAAANPHYGHRNEPKNNAHDRYSNPGNRGAGCNYNGSDAPGMSNMPAGAAYSFNLTFQGKIIDVCNGTDVRTHDWNVNCAGNALGGPGDPLAEVVQEITINGREGLLGVYLYPGDELSVDAAIPNGFGEVPIDAAEVDIDVTGLPPVGFPDPGALPETRIGGNMAHATFDFDYPPGSPDPVHVVLTFGPDIQEFDVDLPALPCPWDLDGNGAVGITDLIALLAAWGNPYTINDLLRLLGAWGPC